MLVFWFFERRLLRSLLLWSLVKLIIWIKKCQKIIKRMYYRQVGKAYHGQSPQNISFVKLSYIKLWIPSIWSCIMFTSKKEIQYFLREGALGSGGNVYLMLLELATGACTDVFIYKWILLIRVHIQILAIVSCLIFRIPQHKSSRSFRHEPPFCEHVCRMPSNGIHLIHFVCISWITLSYVKESWMYLLNTPFGVAKRANWASETHKLDSKKSANWDAQKRELISKSVN